MLSGSGPPGQPGVNAQVASRRVLSSCISHSGAIRERLPSFSLNPLTHKHTHTHACHILRYKTRCETQFRWLILFLNEQETTNLSWNSDGRLALQCYFISRTEEALPATQRRHKSGVASFANEPSLVLPAPSLLHFSFYCGFCDCSATFRPPTPSLKRVIRVQKRLKFS